MTMERGSGDGRAARGGRVGEGWFTLPVVTSLVALIVSETAVSGDMAVHWNLSGEPDSFVSPFTAWLVTGGVAVIAGVVGLADARVPGARGASAVTNVVAFGTSVLFAGLSVLVTVANLGDREPRLSPLGPVALLGLCGLVFVLVTGPSMRYGRLDMGRNKAAEDDRRWQGTCRSRFAVPTFVAFVVVGVVVAVIAGSSGGVVTGVVIALAGLTVLALVEIRVAVVAEHLVVAYSGPLRWPTTSIPLAEVATIEAIDVEPMRYGGWGYRGSLRLFRRAALNLRRGPGLRLVLRDGRVFVVTVDDPEGAVAAATPLLADDRP